MTRPVDKALAIERMAQCATFRKKHGRTPLTTSRNKKERFLAFWMCFMRGAKNRGTGAHTWLPEYNRIAKQLGCYDIFEPESKKVEDWVPIAEKLAKKNKGVLPGSYTLAKMELYGLRKALERHPELFEHIERHPTKEEQTRERVEEAEQLQKMHGYVPHCTWLKNNGYQALYRSILRHPEKFDHLTLTTMHRTVEQWVEVAEELADENSVMPTADWMNQNGYSGLVVTRIKNPKLFRHLSTQAGY